jgi:peroxiredoxin Q/BCP
VDEGTFGDGSYESKHQENPTMTRELKEGDKAPPFSLPGDDGPIALKDLKDTNVVLYFYPKDNTPGCTKEAMGFSELAGAFKKTATVVIGVSKDSLKAHAKFRADHKLKVRLGSDPEAKVINDYGVWVEKTNYGRKYMGIERATFLIDAKGVVRRIWRNVKVAGHADAVLAAAQAL